MNELELFFVGWMKHGEVQFLAAQRTQHAVFTENAMTTIEQYEVALFNREPSVGDINPDGEISYVGYKRVLITAYNETNLTEIVFPQSKQDDPVLASHAVVIDGTGRVVEVNAL